MSEEQAPAAPQDEGLIDIDTFHKLDIRVGEVKSAEKVPDTDKLLRLVVSFGLKPSPVGEGSADQPPAADGVGEEDLRQVVSGIAAYFPEPEALIGRRIAFAYNLKLRTIRGLESRGMILAVGGGEEPFALLEAPEAKPGSRAH